MNEYGNRKERVGVGVTVWWIWSYLERNVEALNGEVE